MKTYQTHNLNEEKSKNYFKDIAFDNLFDLFDQEKESKFQYINTKIGPPVQLKTEEELISEIEKDQFEEISVNQGDNFAKILRKGGLKGRDIDRLLINGKDIYDFSKIYLGDIVKVQSNYNIEDNLEKFKMIYRFSENQELIVNYIDKNFAYEIRQIELFEEKIFVSGEITTSLYQAMKKAGLSELIITEIIRIYSFDVDFQRDIYEGDYFEALFTRRKNDQGKTVQIDDPEYLVLSSRGTPLIYYLYSNDEFSEYFDENGKGMTKSLMKTPINGARLSSNYGMRKHPILGYNKMHKGVDFAAPTGTPIFAAGNGVVEFAGKNGSYGNYIRIRHDSTYKTAYAHLNGFKKGVYGGVRVKQGDVIGFVGSTGRSTGPHLHYEIIVNGKQVNPSTLKLPSGRKLNDQQLEELKKLVVLKNQEIDGYKNKL
ncbi:MAG: hypothetical protein CM15mP70_06550 [Pelagibacteraceae bacterium]|nr:MAG: hypothetical protein CM15mP70_06550 [Pelagibacteraceae bacterium]